MTPKTFAIYASALQVKGWVIIVVSDDVLLPGVGSVTPAGGVTVATLAIDFSANVAPVPVPAVPVTVKDGKAVFYTCGASTFALTSTQTPNTCGN